MATLMVLNGLPGVGKSTLARRLVERRPGSLALDIDVLRSLVGGWRTDPEALLERYRGPLAELITGRPRTHRVGHGDDGAAALEQLVTLLDGDRA